MRMLGPDGRLLQRRYYCSADDEALTSDEIVRGYEWPDGSFTIVTDDELASLAPRKSRDIDLQRFVSRDEIPPKLLERPYVLAPAGDTMKAYRLLAHTMERSRRAGIATFVMRGKEYLAAIFAEGGLLRAATMRFNDELRTPDSIGLPRAPKVGRRRPYARACSREAQDGRHRPRGAPGRVHGRITRARREEASREPRRRRDRGAGQSEDEEESAEVIDIMSVLKERMGAARAPARASRAPRREAATRSGHGASERRASSKPAHGSRARRRTSEGTSSRP